MKKNLITYSIVSVVIALSVVSCTDESEQYTNDTSGIFRLSSVQDIFTRATETTFNPGTAYQLYAITGTDFSMNYLKSPAGTGVVTGTESNDHNSIQNIQANKFDGKTLNFYGVTNSTSTPVNIIENGKSAPTCNIAYQGNEPLTDVMWAKKENQTYKNSGTIKLMFGHTLSKLNLYVLKNSDYGNSSIKLKEISLKDYPSGALNMLTGKYALSNNDKRTHETIVLSNANQDITTTAEPVKNAANENVAPMIFPTRKENLTSTDRTNHSLWINVKVQVESNTVKEESTEITSILAEDPGHNYPEIPFEFKSNHEYDVVITVTGSSLVVTIVPRVYDWIPEEEVKIDSDVNGSMTIGGITWMDRNLGATSGDPLADDQAWENSRGYYYQFGRNIPYYIKTKKDEHGITYAPADGNWHSIASMPYPYIPGHMDDSPNNTSNYSGNNAAQYPTDASKKFNFIYSRDWDENQKYSRENWKNADNQPCPKGWRIPTKNEFQLIIPGSEKAGDIPFLKHTDVEIYTEDVDSDPETGFKSIYIGVKKDKWTETNAGITNSIYALKRVGTNDAYFLRWHIERSGIYKLVNQCNTNEKGDPYRNVLVISRYPATITSELKASNVRNAAKWNNPVEQIKLPISGYIHTGKEYAGTTEEKDWWDNVKNPENEYPALIYSGSEAVYWTSTTNSSKSYTVRMKFAGDAASNQIMMYDSEIRSNGCLIRCVRDTKAN